MKLDPADLVVGKSRETLRLDFKEVYWNLGKSEVWQFELAKDIAAFANSLGGTIVVGAAEKDEVLKGFIDPKLPKKWESSFMRILGTWLNPEPVVTYSLLGLGSDEHEQLAINIDASVSVIFVTNPGDGKRRFCVPLRRGTQTIYASPHRVIEMLDPKHRRLQIRFEEILEIQSSSTGKGLEHLQLLGIRKNHRDLNISQKRWRIWEVYGDRVLLRNPDNGEKLVLPYERVESVYPLNDGQSRWRVLADGKILPFDETHGLGPYLEFVNL